MFSIERETGSLIIKFREMFLCRKTVLRAYVMKSDEKPFFFQIYEKKWDMLRLTGISLYF